MALEALSTNEILDYIVHDTITVDPCNFLPENSLDNPQQPRSGGGASDSGSCMARRCRQLVRPPESSKKRQNAAAQGRKKRQRRPKVCNNKEKAETQRMTHIVVERNRRKLMNEHLAVLRSLMPESYVHRGDQASIVGGAIDYVKELEQLLQSLEAQKLVLLQQGGIWQPTTSTAAEMLEPPFAQFFTCPQFTWSQVPNKCLSKNAAAAAVADIEVTLIETHANLRILCRRNPRQLSKLVTGFQAMYITILHLSVTTLEPLVLYSISAKMEGLCQLTSPEEIAGAIHHMVRIIEEEDIQMLTTKTPNAPL